MAFKDWLKFVRLNHRRLGLLLLAILLIVSSWIGIAVARSGLEVRSLQWEGLPLLYLAPQAANSVAGVLIAHGLAGSKQLMLGYGHVLAHAGYAVTLRDFDVNHAIVITLFVLAITSLAIGYGVGVKAQHLPFTAEIGFSEQQWSFLKGWVKLALIVGVVLPIVLWVGAWGQPFSMTFWEKYLLVVAVQLISERVFSQWLVPSIVVPIGFGYTAFRLWQLLDGFTQLSLSRLAEIGFVGVVLFWMANLIMLTTIAIPTIYKGQSFQE